MRPLPRFADELDRLLAEDDAPSVGDAEDFEAIPEPIPRALRFQSRHADAVRVCVDCGREISLNAAERCMSCFHARRRDRLARGG